MHSRLMLKSRALVIGVLLATVALPAYAAQKLTASLIGPMETAQGQGLKRFAERLGELTAGELVLDIYPDGQLGGLTENFEQVQNGTIDITVTPPGIMAEFLPEIQVYAIPFVFRDYDHWKLVVRGAIGEDIASQARERADVLILGYYGGSVRQLVTRKKVRALDDMKNLRIRLHPTEVQIAAWRSVRAIPTVLGYREIYNALQLGVIDALENEPEWIVRMKFYEQAPYIALTSHEIVTRPLVFSRKTFESLSPELQRAVLLAGSESADFEREIERQFDQENLSDLRDKHGATIIKVDNAVFREKAQAALAPVLKKQGLTDLVEQIKAIE